VIRHKLAVACLGLAFTVLHMEAGPAGAAGPRDGIDVLEPVDGAPWSGDRMNGARERVKDVLPGKRR
jgi:hypothetical protein